MGDSGAGVALPPRFDASRELVPCSLPLTLSQQQDKAMALGMMHDLQPRAPFNRAETNALEGLFRQLEIMGVLSHAQGLAGQRAAAEEPGCDLETFSRQGLDDLLATHSRL